MNLSSRRSIRIRGYDYSSPGAYFVTICATDRRHLFGSVKRGQVFLNSFGKTVKDTWHRLPELYPMVVLDEMIVMPNHVHAIIVIREGAHRPTVSEVVRTLKSISARRINQERGKQGVSVWQRGFFERIIRDTRQFTNVQEYIRMNPLRWSMERKPQF